MLLLLVSVIALLSASIRPPESRSFSVKNSGRRLVRGHRAILDADRGLSKRDVIEALGLPEPRSNNVEDDFGFSLVYRSSEFSGRELWVRPNPREAGQVTGFFWVPPRPSVLARGPVYLGDLPIQEDLWKEAAIKQKFTVVNMGPEGIVDLAKGSTRLMVQCGHFGQVTSDKLRLPNGASFRIGDRLDDLAASLRNCDLMVDSYVPGCLIRCSSPPADGYVARLSVACNSYDGQIRAFHAAMQPQDSPPP